MALKLANNAVSKLAGAVTAGATSFAVTPGEGVKFPVLGAGDWFPLTVVKSSGAFEVMRCTARATDTFTVSRAQEGTAALGFDPGDRVELRWTNAAYSGMVADIKADSNASYFPLSGLSPATVATTANTVAPVVVRNGGGAGDTDVAALGFLCGSTYGAKLYLRADGVMGIGGWSATAWKWYVNTVDGTMTAAGNIIAFSDESLKKDWADLPPNFIEQLAGLLHGTYTRTDTGLRQVGVGAQSLQKFLPEAVVEGEKLGVAYGNAALVAAVKLAQRVVDLDKRLAALED